MRRKPKLLTAMNDKELAGALLVRLVNNDMLTGVITELCTRLQRDAPRLFAYKIKYLCNLLREKARAYDRNVWVKFASEHQEDYIFQYMDDLTEYLSTYAEAWENAVESDYKAAGVPFANILAWLQIAGIMCMVDTQLSKNTTIAPVAMRVLDTKGINSLCSQLYDTLLLTPSIKTPMNKYKSSVEAYKAGNEYFNQLTNFENYNKIIK